MFRIIRKYKWCKQMGINHPIKAALDKNFLWWGTFKWKN